MAILRFLQEVMAAGSQAVESVDLAEELDFEDEDRWRYAPELGNVAFGSAVHGWAFRLDTFATMWAEKLNAKVANLQRVLWGDWSYRVKEMALRDSKEGLKMSKDDEIQ